MNDIEHVKATIAGKEMVLCINRDDLPIFEATLGAPAYALLGAIKAGKWTVAQVRDTVRFASLPAAQLDIARLVGGGSATFKTLRNKSATPLLDHVFATQPPSRYVPLAMLILSAALFGIPSDEAVFDDAALQES